jgi:ATP diphosphatase
MARLRDPLRGCPWDRQQTFHSIAPYTLEEAYEVADAIQRNALDELRDELGDLLFQVVYHARLAEEAGAFDFADVVAAICAKMLRRHPHVFGTEKIGSATAQSEAWERFKSEERGQRGVLDDIPLALPALVRAAKLGRRAARVGFDWPDASGVQAKVAEEQAELDEALSAHDDQAAAVEMGDLLFSLVNLCRHLGLDAETCLRRANERFEARFRHVEQRVDAAGGRWADFDLEALEQFWREAKGLE